MYSTEQGEKKEEGEGGRSHDGGKESPLHSLRRTGEKTRDPEKDEEINFGVKDREEAKWVGVTFTSDLSWKKHNDRRLNQAEAAWVCISRLGTSRGA